MASRTQVAVLEPTPNNALNTLQASPPPLKKRKFSHDGYMKTKGICISQFTIRVCANLGHQTGVRRMNSPTNLLNARPMPRRCIPMKTTS